MHRVFLAQAREVFPVLVGFEQIGVPGIQRVEWYGIRILVYVDRPQRRLRGVGGGGVFQQLAAGIYGFGHGGRLLEVAKKHAVKDTLLALSPKRREIATQRAASATPSALFGDENAITPSSRGAKRNASTSRR